VSELSPTRPFVLADRPVLSRSTLNRDEMLVNDQDAQTKLWPKARLLTVDQYGCVPVRALGTELVYRPAAEFADPAPADSVLLGEQDGVGYWATRIRRDDGGAPNRWGWAGPAPDGDPEEERWLDLRAIGALLGSTDAGAFTTAVAVLNWHRDAPFCPRCGLPVRFTKAGWASRCTGCDKEEYPRTDPAVICLVHDGTDGGNGQHVLLARGAIWPEGRYSVLAGFVEAGESLEDCVVREISEEVGVDVRDVRYLGNQPWPFPRSLMIGYTAVADPAAPIHPADGEIAEARWVPRAEVRATLAAGGSLDGLALPGKVSIAGHMLAAWAEAEA
jgi:NAD+ diphosphatase